MEDIDRLRTDLANAPANEVMRKRLEEERDRAKEAAAAGTADLQAIAELERITDTFRARQGEPDAIRDVLLAAAGEEIHAMLREDTDYAAGNRTMGIESLLTAAARADEIHGRSPAASAQQPAINVERLAADVWHAAQEHEVLAALGDTAIETGTTTSATAIADVAAAAVRKVLER